MVAELSQHSRWEEAGGGGREHPRADIPGWNIGLWVDRQGSKRSCLDPEVMLDSGPVPVAGGSSLLAAVVCSDVCCLQRQRRSE